jgi:hypothetical protein
MGSEEESEMRGLSVEFIAHVLPELIAALGDVHGHFCTLGGKAFCGCKDAKDCPARRGALAGADVRPYDADGPLFRRKTKDLLCPRDGLPGCAFVDFVHAVRPFVAAAVLPSPHRSAIMCARRGLAASTRAGRRSCSATRGGTRSA